MLAALALAGGGDRDLPAAAAARPDPATRIPIAGLRGSLQNPCFSPDSARIAFAALVAMSADGGRTTRVTRGPGWYDGAPTWSPDGTTIAFESRRGEPDEWPGTRLYRIDAP